MKDERTAMEKRAWDLVGPPLYYCSECLRMVKVTTIDGEHTIERKCDHTAEIIAPRRSILAGEGGLSLANKARMTWYQLASWLTGRTV